MAQIDDVRGMSEQVQNQQRKLDDAGIPDVDRDAIEACFNRLKGGEWKTVDSDGHRLELDGWRATTTRRDRLSQLRLSAERSETPLTSFDHPDDVRTLLSTHADAGAVSNAAQCSYASALSSLFAFLDAHRDYGDYPWFKHINLPQRNDAPKDPDSILDPADVDTLAEHADAETRALVQFLADSGLRITAALQLRVEHVDVGAGEYRLNPDGVGQKGADGHPMTWHDLFAPQCRHALREWVESSPSRSAESG